jgi:hypothetical protein
MPNLKYKVGDKVFVIHDRGVRDDWNSKECVVKQVRPNSEFCYELYSSELRETRNFSDIELRFSDEHEFLVDL